MRGALCSLLQSQGAGQLFFGEEEEEEEGERMWVHYIFTRRSNRMRITISFTSSDYLIQSLTSKYLRKSKERFDYLLGIVHLRDILKYKIKISLRNCFPQRLSACMVPAATIFLNRSACCCPANNSSVRSQLTLAERLALALRYLATQNSQAS